MRRATSLDTKAAGNRFSVRWNLVKVIQEYARHNGHADIIRERSTVKKASSFAPAKAERRHQTEQPWRHPSDQS